MWGSSGYRATWLFVRLPALFIVFVTGLGVFRCLSMPGTTDTTFDAIPSPSGMKSILISASDLGATGWGDAVVSIVADKGVVSNGGCVVLVTSHRGLEGGRDGGSDIDVRWLDDEHVRLTYPAARVVRNVATKCPGVEIAHVMTP